MEWQDILMLDLGLLIALMVIGVPIAFAFLAVNLVCVVILVGPKGVLLVNNSMMDLVSSFSLAALPLFVLMGSILSESNAIAILFDAIDKWIGRVRARLHVIAVIVATIFAAIGGSNIASVAMLGGSIYPEMNRRGYDRKLGAAAICGGASLAPIIPPSNLAIILAMLANVSIAQLLISGIVPGILISALILGYVLLRVRLNPKLAPVYEVAAHTWGDKFRGLAKALPFSLLIFLVIGTVMIGIATPTEAAAMAVLGALVIAFAFGRLSWRLVGRSINDTMKVSAMVLLVMAAASAFSQLLGLSGAARGIVEVINEFDLPPAGMLFLMHLIPFLLCLFMDQIAVMMILTPIYLPIVAALNFDPVWFWCTMLVNVTIGAITPPFGYVLFTMKGVTSDLSLQDLYKAILPFVGILLLGLVLVIVFPGLATWLPGLMS
jgi:tripartite ATP-independent transporter DctM subunit